MTGGPFPAPDRGAEGGSFADFASKAAPNQQEFFANPRAYRAVATQIQHIESARLFALYNPRGDEFTLDVGSGDGKFTATHLVPAFPKGRVFGLDIGLENVRAASADYADRDYGDIAKPQFLVGDIRNQGQWYQTLQAELGEGNKLDLVFTNSTLHHIYTWEGQSRALANIVSLLNEGGKFLNSMAGQGNFDQLVSIGMDLANMNEWSKYFKGFEYPLLRPDVDTYAQHLRAGGLEPEYIELAPLVIPLQDKATLLQFCRGCMRSFMNHLRQALEQDGSQEVDRALDDFAASMADRFVAESGVSDGDPIPFQEVNLEVRARKVSS